MTEREKTKNESCGLFEVTNSFADTYDNINITILSFYHVMHIQTRYEKT